jgi:sarcosine oxidase subunit beta
MAAQQNYDVLIIGAGVVGCSIALGLSRRNLKTLNLDRLPAAGYGSTSHSSAIVRSFYSHVTSCAIAHECRFLWQRWEDHLRHIDSRGMARYTECGGLILVREGEQERYRRNLEVLKTVGVEFQWLDRDGVRALYPEISLDAFGPPKRSDAPGFGEPVAGTLHGGIFLPEAGYVSDPQLAAHNLQSAAAASGAEFRFDSQVVEVLRNEQRVFGLRLADGTRLHGALIINAAGPHSARINDLAGIGDSLRISTEAQRHEVAYLAAPTSYREHGNGFVVDLDTGVYQRPDGADLLIGTTDPECDPPDVVDPDGYSTELSEQWTTQVHRSAQRFPTLGIENTARGTVGLYDVSSDWIPIYDKTDLEGYYLAIGTSGNQFKNAPLIGELTAAIVCAGLEGIDHDCNPAQLALRQLGRTVDLSFYSRNREIQDTASVLA